MPAQCLATTKLLVVGILIWTSTIVTANVCPRAEQCVNLLDKGEKCPLFPMVPGSIAAPPGPDGFILQRLRPYVYFYSDGAYQATIAYSTYSKHLVVVDFPRGPNSVNQSGDPHLISATYRIVGLSRPRHISLIYSHHHLDHIGSAAAYYSFVRSEYPTASVKIWGTDEAKKVLSRHSPPKAPLPTAIIGSGLVRLKLNKFVKIEMSTLPAHTRSDVLLYIPPSTIDSNNGIVHFVDLLSPREAPFSGFTFTTDLRQFLDAHGILLKKSFQYFISGHGILGNKQDVSVNQDYTKFVINSIQEAPQKLDPLDTQKIITRVGDPDDVAFGNGVWSFISIINLQIDICIRETILKWGCRLSAVDIFVESHCRTAAFYALIEL